MLKSIKNKRTYLLTGLLLSFFVLLLIKPDSVMESGKNALDLCLNIIIPSLFPFFVVSRLILSTGAIHTISRLFRPVMKPLFNLPGSAAFPLLAGWLSGYPAGAKYTVDLFEKNMLSRSEAQRLLAFCNNSGPIFIVGAVGAGYFQSPQLGLLLLISHLLASVTIGIGAGLISRKNEANEQRKKPETAGKKTAFNGRILSDAIINSITVLLQICGTILFFAVTVQTLENAGVFTFISKLADPIIGANNYCLEITRILFSGSLEITYGLFLLSKAVNTSVTQKIIIAALLCGFGGFSVHTQVTGICPPSFKFKNYYIGKLLHGMLAAAYTGLFLINRSIPVMKSGFALYDTSFIKFLMVIYALLLILIILYVISIRSD